MRRRATKVKHWKTRRKSGLMKNKVYVSRKEIDNAFTKAIAAIRGLSELLKKSQKQQRKMRNV